MAGNYKKRIGRQKLTKRDGIGDNLGGSGAKLHIPPADARMIALVRLLGRKAAERDYARLIRRNGSNHQRLPEDDERP